MAGEISYRTGRDQRTGEMISGPRHLAQSLGKIIDTRLNTMPMLLDFGMDLRSFLSEDLTPALALSIYTDIAAAFARWEPEYEIRQVQLVRLTDSGALGLRHGGLYYPEGRLGNYDLAVSLSLDARGVGAR